MPLVDKLLVSTVCVDPVAYVHDPDGHVKEALKKTFLWKCYKEAFVVDIVDIKRKGIPLTNDKGGYNLDVQFVASCLYFVKGSLLIGKAVACNVAEGGGDNVKKNIELVVDTKFCSISTYITNESTIDDITLDSYYPLQVLSVFYAIGGYPSILADLYLPDLRSVWHLTGGGDRSAQTAEIVAVADEVLRNNGGGSDEEKYNIRLAKFSVGDRNWLPVSGILEGDAIIPFAPSPGLSVCAAADKELPQKNVDTLDNMLRRLVFEKREFQNLLRTPEFDLIDDSYFIYYNDK
ncbi:MAG TPA: hypothetical protein VFQ26_02115 [Nitrospiraceae bacterium]|nr:hypothetical protein [Nitrospiraceae bacterium]